jgi:hypothetical protein
MQDEKKSKVGPKEQSLRDLREARVLKAKGLIDKTFGPPKAAKLRGKTVVQFKKAVKRGRTGR